MSKAWMGVIIGVVTLAVGITGTYVYMQNKNENKMSSLESRITELEGEATTSDVSATVTTSSSPSASTSVSAENEKVTLCNQLFPNAKIGPMTDDSPIGFEYCYVEKLEGNYASGGTNQKIDENGGPGAGFIATKVNGKWTIVQRSQDVYSCSLLRQYNVPEDFLGNDKTCSNEQGEIEEY